MGTQETTCAGASHPPRPNPLHPSPPRQRSWIITQLCPWWVDSSVWVGQWPPPSPGGGEKLTRLVGEKGRGGDGQQGSGENYLAGQGPGPFHQPCNCRAFPMEAFVLP